MIGLSDILDDHLATIGCLDLLGHYLRIEWVLRSTLDCFRGDCCLVGLVCGRGSVRLLRLLR